MLKSLLYFLIGVQFTTAVNTKPTNTTTENNNKTINLALETVLEFKHQEHHNDIKFLNKVEKFIGKVKTIITKNNVEQRDFKIDKFTDLIFVIVKILNKYEDRDLELFSKIFNKEIRNYHYKGSKFHELIKNHDLKRYVARKLDEVKNLTAFDLREIMLDIATTIVQEEYNPEEKKLVDYINSLYSQETLDKFYNILINIDDYGLKTRRNMDLAAVVKDALRAIVFDFYTGLKGNARKSLSNKLQEFWNFKNLGSNIRIDNKINTDVEDTPEIIRMPKNVLENKDTTNTAQTLISVRNQVVTEPNYEEDDGDLSDDSTDAIYSSADAEFNKKVSQNLKLTFKTLYPTFIPVWKPLQKGMLDTITTTTEVTTKETTTIQSTITQSQKTNSSKSKNKYLGNMTKSINAKKKKSPKSLLKTKKLKSNKLKTKSLKKKSHLRSTKQKKKSLKEEPKSLKNKYKSLKKSKTKSKKAKTTSNKKKKKKSKQKNKTTTPSIKKLKESDSSTEKENKTLRTAEKSEGFDRKHLTQDKSKSENVSTVTHMTLYPSLPIIAMSPDPKSSVIAKTQQEKLLELWLGRKKHTTVKARTVRLNDSSEGRSIFIEVTMKPLEKKKTRTAKRMKFAKKLKVQIDVKRPIFRKSMSTKSMQLNFVKQTSLPRDENLTNVTLKHAKKKSNMDNL